jgi:urea transport system substrate-binding protein
LALTDDPIEAAYFQVHLFAKAVVKAKSLIAHEIREAARGLVFHAPGGEIRIDEENLHTWKKVRIGRISAQGVIEIVHESQGLVRPDPYMKEHFPGGLVMAD